MKLLLVNGFFMAFAAAANPISSVCNSCDMDSENLNLVCMCDGLSVAAHLPNCVTNEDGKLKHSPGYTMTFDL